MQAIAAIAARVLAANFAYNFCLRKSATVTWKGSIYPA
jgi:hypothetical protein